MKPQPEVDFPVTAWPLSADKAGPLAELYSGIWRLTLNYTVDILFVPPFIRRVDSWPPRLPEDIDAPADEIAARLITVAMADYSVTVSEQLNGGEELLPSCDPLFDEPEVLFYVGEEDFAAYDDELARLYGRLTSWRHGGPRISELAGQRIEQFLSSRFLASPHVDRRSLRILGR